MTTPSEAAIENNEENSEELTWDCKGCLFAQKDDKGAQTGCKLKVLERMEKQGTEIKDAYDEEDDKFKVIYGRVCPFKREKYWQEFHQKKGEEDLAAIVRKECEFKCSAVIFIDIEQTLEDVQKTVSSLLNQEIPPVAILFALKSTRIGVVQLQQWCIQNIPKKNIQWRFEVVLDEEVSREEAMHITIKKVESLKSSRYFITFNAGYEVPQGLFSKFDHMINEDLDRFVQVEPDESGNGFLCNVKLFKNAGGFFGGQDFIDMIKRRTEEDECQHLNRKYQAILESL
jgi:hypothetical protein